MGFVVVRLVALKLHPKLTKWRFARFNFFDQQ
jgi:hypothetical protein